MLNHAVPLSNDIKQNKDPGKDDEGSGLRPERRRKRVGGMGYHRRGRLRRGHRPNGGRACGVSLVLWFLHALVYRFDGRMMFIFLWFIQMHRSVARL